MTALSRRKTLALLSGTLGSLTPLPHIVEAAERPPPISLGTYGLPGYSVLESIELLSTIGYDSIEIASMPGYHGAPDQLTAAQRREVRARASARQLPIGALMGLPTPTDAPARQQRNLDWFERLLELARDLSSERPPLIQGVLGGGNWEEKQSLFRDTLGSWIELADKANIALSIKPHRGHAMSLLEQGIWLIDQLNATGKMTLVYDFSHYAFRGIEVDESIAIASPHLGYVVVKDAVIVGDGVRFQLPGASRRMPHAEILEKLSSLGYRGEVCCEISSQVWKQNDYDPKKAAQTCFANVSQIYEAAGLQR